MPTASWFAWKFGLAQYLPPSDRTAEPGAAGKPPGSLLSAMTLRNSTPHLATHALPRPEAASA